MLNQIKPANAVFPPQKILVYGVAGVGKNTFASTFRSPILLQVEDGSAALGLDAFPLCLSFNDISDVINALHEDHQYKTLVVDSLDWIEPLMWQACCDHHGKVSIEEFGYGKGYIELDKWWRHLMAGFDSLRHRKGMDIVLLAHSEVKHVEPPDTDPYDTYQIKMQKRSFALWQEYADMVLFLNYKINVQRQKTGIDQVKTRGIGTGERVIHTTERPAWKAKSRWPLPEEILIGKDKTWSAFHKNLSEATDGKYINPIQATTKEK